MAESKKKKKPGYVAKADEVTKKVDKAVGDTLKNLAKPSKNSKAAYLTKNKPKAAAKATPKAPGAASAAPVDKIKVGKPKGSHGLARPEAPGSYPKAPQKYGSSSPKNTDKGTGFGGSSVSPSKVSNSPKTRGPTKDYGDLNPPQNPGSKGKSKQPVKAGQDPNAEWRRAQLTGQGDRWDATRGKMKRAGSNR